MRYLFVLLLLFLANCSRIKNSVSVVRMDCGSEATWNGSYLRFVDLTGRELEYSNLHIRSLDDKHGASPNVTSKGCLIADQPGLWMVRHQEKLEGLIVQVEPDHQSEILQLQDVSRETLELVCPKPDLSEVLDPNQFIPDSAPYDKRGYQLRIQIRSGKSDEPKTWPWLNLARAEATLVGGLVNEGEASVDLELQNYFRLGESTKKTCSVKFDYTAAMSYASVQKAVPVQYQSRPFYFLNAEEDLHFVSDDPDIAFHEVCVKPRPDWVKGDIHDDGAKGCENFQIVKAGDNLLFPERQGFWQIQYRSVDKAQNRSSWSPVIIVLLEQVSKMQAIKSKAAYIATVVEAKPVDGAANAIVASLELQKLWKALPTRYERDRLENIVLLSLHRPWLRGTIRQDLLFQSTNSERLIKSVFLDGETKIVSFLQNISDLPDRYRELRYYNMKTKQWKKLARINYSQLGGREWFELSQDQKTFVFGFTPMGAVWVGRVKGDDIEIQEVTIEGTGEETDYAVWFAGLINNDETLIVNTDNEKLTFDMNNLNAPPLREPNLQPTADYKISEDGNYVLVRNYKTGIMTWTPITDPTLPKKEIDLHDYINSTATNLMHFDVLGPDRYLIVYPSTRVGPCVYTELARNANGSMELRRLTDGASCLDSITLAPNTPRAIMNDNMDAISTLLFDNLSGFSKRIPTPGEETPIDEVVDYHIPDFFGQSKDLKYLIYEWWNKSKEKYELVFLERSGTGEYVESFLSSLDSGYSYYPLYFAEDIGVVLGFWGGSVSARGYREDTKDFHEEIDRDGCDARSGAYLGRGRLALGCIKGPIKIYDVSKPGIPTIDSILPSKDGPAWVLVYDEINNLLIGGFGGVAGDLYIWPNADIHAEPQRREVFRSGMGMAALSIDGRYLAVGPSGREEMYLKVFNIHDMDAPPSILEGHSSYISKMSFFGKGSLLVSASNKGILKIWDAAHPDFPGVTVPMQKGGEVYGLLGINGKNEFIVGNDWEEIYHFRLDTLAEIRARSCEFLQPYFQDNSPLTPEQKKLCDK